MAQQEAAAAADPQSLVEVLTGPLVWTSERRLVLVNDRPFRIKGINWYEVFCIGVVFS